MNPLLLLLLGGGAIYALTKKPVPTTAHQTNQPSVAVPPTALPPPDDMPDIPAQNQPSVQVTPPVTAPTTYNLPNPLSVPSASTPDMTPEPTAATPQAQSPGVPVQPAISIPDIIKQLPTDLQQAATSAASVLAPVVAAAQAQAQTQTPLQSADVASEQDTAGSVALAKALIDRESTPNWKAALKPQIRAWQSIVGLKPDGEFGVAGALRMSQDVGILPLVRYWPAETQEADQVPLYQQQINQIASSVEQANSMHAIALRLSAGFENGSGYERNPKPVDPSLRQQQSAALTQAVASQAVANASTQTVKAT